MDDRLTSIGAQVEYVEIHQDRITSLGIETEYVYPHRNRISSIGIQVEYISVKKGSANLVITSQVTCSGTISTVETHNASSSLTISSELNTVASTLHIVHEAQCSLVITSSALIVSNAEHAILSGEALLNITSELTVEVATEHQILSAEANLAISSTVSIQANTVQSIIEAQASLSIISELNLESSISHQTLYGSASLLITSRIGSKSTSILVSGAGVPDINGIYSQDGLFNDKPIYYYYDELGTMYYIYWIKKYSKWTMNFNYELYKSYSDVWTPDLATWELSYDGILPIPTVSAIYTIPASVVHAIHSAEANLNTTSQLEAIATIEHATLYGNASLIITSLLTAIGRLVISKDKRFKYNEYYFDTGSRFNIEKETRSYNAEITDENYIINKNSTDYNITKKDRF